MSQWQRRLDIKDVWQRAQNDEFTPQEVATVIAEKLSGLEPFTESLEDDYGMSIEETRQELAADFRAFAKDETQSANDFDSLMEMLYNWADTRLDDHFNGKAVCWVGTF